MKAHRRITRAIRALAVTGCFAALAVPASALARPLEYHPVSQQVKAIAAAQAYHTHGRPAAYAGDQSYTLPAGFKSDSPSGSNPSNYNLPAGFTSDGAGSGYQPVSSTQPTSVIVREVPTNSNDHTLAIVLASAALGIALCGSGYAVFRTTRLQRRLVQSS
jgi:hypothetical protein